jgi:hypothetical protein
MRGIAYPACEWNIIVVGEVARSPRVVRVGDVSFLIDAYPTLEALEQALEDPLKLLASTEAKVLRDPEWVLSSALSYLRSNRPGLAERARRSCCERGLLYLSRATRVLNTSNQWWAGYWITAAAYQLAFGLLVDHNKVPSPSHLIGQVREVDENTPHSWMDVLRDALSLDKATKGAVARRLRAVKSLLEARGEGDVANVVSEKVAFLIGHHQTIEAYSYLGYLATQIGPIKRASKQGLAGADASLTHARKVLPRLRAGFAHLLQKG